MLHVRGRTAAGSRGAALARRCRQAGAMAAMLRPGGMTRDLTAPNLVVPGNPLFVADFGPASFTLGPEGRAVGLRLFKR